MKFFAAALLATLVAGFAPGAFAQLGTSTGFPIGEKSRIHTNLETGVGFDSNGQRFDNDRDDEGQLEDWRAIIRPSIAIDVPGSSFRMGLRSAVTVTQFFGTGTANSETSVGANVGINMQLGSDQSIVSFKLANELVRTPTFFDEPGTIASDEFRFRQWFNSGSARLTFRPGGRALEFDVGYLNRLTFYDTLELPRGQQHGGLFEARWRFLPKTVLMFHADAAVWLVDNDPEQFTTEGTPINVYMGAIGQVTSKIQAELTAGYSDTLSDVDARSVRGPNAAAVITYNISETILLSGGYRRRIAPTVTLSAFSSDTGFLRFRAQLFGRLVFQLYGQYERRTFPELPNVPGLDDGSFADLITGDARTEYFFFEWLRLSLNYRVLVQTPENEARVPLDQIGTDQLPGLQKFNRHQFFLNVGLLY